MKTYRAAVVGCSRMGGYRWSVAYDQMKALVDRGELGTLKNIIIYNNGTLFNTGSHYIDLVMRLNSDQPAIWAQGNLRAKAEIFIFAGDIVCEDPVGEGLVYFANWLKPRCQ